MYLYFKDFKLHSQLIYLKVDGCYVNQSIFVNSTFTSVFNYNRGMMLVVENPNLTNNKMIFITHKELNGMREKIKCCRKCVNVCGCTFSIKMTDNCSLENITFDGIKSLALDNCNNVSGFVDYIDDSSQEYVTSKPIIGKIC